MTRRCTFFAAVCLVLGALSLQGCGFQPIYAQKTSDSAGGLQAINLISVVGPADITAQVERAFEDRKLAAPARPTAYTLTIVAEEAAQRLAVQIDASVTRFNYSLRADYYLVRLEDGAKFSGATSAVASFNVVTSQYSTLTAEESARDKAAEALIEALERDILLKLDAPDERREDKNTIPRDLPIEIDPDFSRQ